MQEEIEKAKAFLLKTNTTSNKNLYDHLSEVLSKILDERPNNCIGKVSFLEIFLIHYPNICQLLETNFFSAFALKSVHVSLLLNNLTTNKNGTLKQINQSDLKKDGDGEGGEPETEEDVETPLPDLMNLTFYFEQAGIGLSREEMFRVFLALKQLVDTKPLQMVRFWGRKIIAYYSSFSFCNILSKHNIRESSTHRRWGHWTTLNFAADQGEGEGDDQAKEEDKGDEDEEGGEEDDTPKPDWKPPPVIPKEDNRTGTNKRTFFVTTEPGKPWVKLPAVTPAQIVTARSIKKFFTGRLDAPIVSYPPFPGNEMNYLRAQIARISAGAQISPAGFFMFEEEEEEEEEGEVRDSYMLNVDFEGISVRELADPSLHNWAHHVQHVLPQGRCVWHNPIEKPEDDFEEEEEEEEREDVEEPKPESGPQLLTSIAEDEPVNGMPAWTPYVSSELLPQYGLAVMRSNRWPGAVAFAKDRKFENIYVGWGHKFDADNYTPPPPPAAMEEYPVVSEVTEVDDPTVEEERALKKAQEEAMEAAEDMDDVDDDEDDDD
ncbi:radial spoke head protein 6 homolog A-like [Orbicella faveolata]|uniref:radial spoke head protein 6 homolog A-like n=2 Tax=Orbicella faveolata TaxID=48498 RepID=UPI0009E2688B|nr:radial spoke head protein 6 homolog A-like [Orbicella faveolata]